MNKKGIGVLELVVSMTLLSLILTLTLSGFKSLFSLLEATQAVRTVTCALNTARYRAVESNQPAKVEAAGNGLVVKVKQGAQWIPVQEFDLQGRIRLKMTECPVFFPSGWVAPTTTIELKVGQRAYEITTAITGRVKVLPII